MSVPDQIPKTEHVVSGGNVTQFSYDFYAPNTANVYVLVNSSAVSSGWSVSSNAGGSGYVNFDSAVVAGATVTIYRSTPMEQNVVLEQGDSFYPQVLTECMDNVVMGMQERRGGSVNIPGEGAASAVYARSAGSAASAGYAATAGYAYSAGIAYDLDSSVVATSAGHATTAAGLDAGTIVASAAHATNADSATIANGTEFATNAGYAFSAGVAPASGGTASYASSAGYATNAGYATSAGWANNAGGADYASSAGLASSLTSDAKADILGSAGGKYVGPFAVTHVDGDLYDVAEGRVFAGGTSYVVDGVDGVQVDANYLYLVMSSGGGSASSYFQEGPPASTTVDMLVTRIAGCSGGVVNQIQFGDITCVPWGATGGSGSVNAYVTSMAWGTQHTADADGVILAQVYMSPASTAGETAYVTIGSTVYYLAQVPSSGLTSEGYCCARMLPVNSGQTWSAHGLNYGADNQLFFLAFNGGTMNVN